MKRMKYIAMTLLLCSAASASAQERYDSLYQPQVVGGMPFRVMKPLGLLAFDTQQSYPVIVSLHGAGGRGTGNDKQLRDWNRQLAEEQRRKDFPCYVVAPQAGSLWNAEHLNKIQALIKTLPSVNTDRIYVMGHSMGGHGTYIFIQLAPDYFAAAAPSAGSGKQSTRDFIDPAKIKDMPIWAFHGDKDHVCPFDKDHKVFREVKKLGGNMKFTTWTGDSHGVSHKTIPGAENGTTEFGSDRCDKEADFMTWMFSQSRSSSPSGASAPSKPLNEDAVLQSGEYFVTQSWSQEQNFKRPYYVNVPTASKTKDADQSQLPVLIFLHGNGGNAKEAMRGALRNRSRIASRYIMVFAQGYQESWNIVSERSKADDLAFIESIVKKLATYRNVSADNFSIMGSSNGAALVNQIAIESKLPNIRNYISGVSPLNQWQYDGKQFKAKGDDNNYRVATVPMSGKRLLNISGTEDRLVPYRGGLSRAIPAKDGKLAFVAAEKSTFLWAKVMGHGGEQLVQPTSTDDNIQIFSYLDGDVVHCKVNNQGHGATHEIPEQTLLDFLDGSSNAR